MKSLGRSPLFVSKREFPLPLAEAFEIFQALSPLFPGPKFFFQKCTQKSDDGVFDSLVTRMGFESFEEIRFEKDGNHIGSKNETFCVSGSPFDVVHERLQNRILTEELKDFEAAAFGYFGYETVQHVEPILKNHPGSFQKSQHRHNGDGEFHLFSTLLTLDHVQKKLTIAVVHYEPHDPQDSYRKIERIRAQALRSKASDFRYENFEVDFEIPASEFEATLGRETFKSAVKKIKSHIAAGDIFQAVISDKFERLIQTKPQDFFRVLCAKSPSAYPFYFETSRGVVVLGSSPEMLLTANNGKLETHPIAGTRPRGRTQDEERRLMEQLLKSSKENAEHLMLVDLARNDLGRISRPGTVCVPEQGVIRKFPGVMHLVSRVVGELSPEKNAFQALASCFPAGTLSGAPKIRAMQIIYEVEAEPRGFYGGGIVVADYQGQLESCIAIRCVEIQDSKITLRAGAGIVADSRPEFEYDEILHKTRALRRVLAVAEALFPVQQSLSQRHCGGITR